MTELIYGKLPRRNEYALLDKEAGEKMQKAFDCSTWGEYAQIAGMDWETFLQEWRPAIERLRESDDEIRPDTPMGTDWASIAGSHYIGDLVRDARMEAVHALPSDIDYSADPVLQRDLDIGGGSPGPNIDTITASEPDTFERLEEILHKQGYSEFSVEHDQEFVEASYAGFQ